MKKVFLAVLLSAALFLCACSVIPQYTPFTTPCSLDGIEDFHAAARNANPETCTDAYFESARYLNVTPAEVAAETPCRIFKSALTCEAYILLDGELYDACTSMGGWGFVNAVPCDFDADGCSDLLIASSWGSGLHRSELWHFNTQTKESLRIYSSADEPEAANVDLFVSAHGSAPACRVYTASITPEEGNFAALSLTPESLYGSIEAENGLPVFRAE